MPGFFDEDGGGSAGDVWRARFTPDAAGVWSYQASFRSGPNVAVDLDPTAGTPAAFDGAAGTFEVADQVFAKPGELYAVYIPDTTKTATLDISGASGSIRQRWYNPRLGAFDGASSIVTGGGNVGLGQPLGPSSEDWVVLLEKIDAGQGATGFTLMDTDADQPIMPLTDGTTLNLNALPTRNLNVRAGFSNMTVGSVGFVLDAGYNRVEDTPPYSLAGDIEGDYEPWTPTVGSHTLTATPYSMSMPDANGTAGVPLRVDFVVTEE